MTPTDEAPAPQPEQLSPSMRILLVALELTDPIFSGNGVYGRTIVESLLSSGHHITVLCGSPADAPAASAFATNPALATALEESRLQVGRVPLKIWRKVDRSAAWQEFADGIATEPGCAALCQRGNYDLAVGIDWTAAAALATALRLLTEHQSTSAKCRPPPVVHMNFRVFFAQLELLVDGSDDEAFYRAREREACTQADRVIALTSADASTLNSLLLQQPPQQSQHMQTQAGERIPHTPMVVLNPPLRPDIAALALGAGSSTPITGERCVRARMRIQVCLTLLLQRV